MSIGMNVVTTPLNKMLMSDLKPATMSFNYFQPESHQSSIFHLNISSVYAQEPGHLYSTYAHVSTLKVTYAGFWISNIAG